MSDNKPAPTETPGAFYSLPNELLITIVMNLVDPLTQEHRQRVWYKDKYRLLKCLRLVHRRFTNLACINIILFTSIQLEPTASCLRSLERGDVSRVAGYVRSITFVTPPSWALLFETYSSIVTVSALKIRAKELETELGRKYFPDYWFPTSLQDKFVDEHLGGQWPLSEAQLRDGFATYMKDAEATKALLEDDHGPLKKAWVGLLGKIGTPLRKVRFVSQDCSRMHQQEYYDTPNTPYPDPRLRFDSHEHSNADEEYGCQQATAIAGDRLFAMAVSCLATSGVSVRRLTIKSQMTGNFDWKKLDLSFLDLSLLEKLKFGPGIPEIEYRGVKVSVATALPSLPEEQIEQHASEALHDLIAKCHVSLQHLELNGWGPMTWPSQPASLDMPALESLHISFGYVNPALLKGWMEHMPRLRHLELMGSCLAGDVPFKEWSYLFDAIRDHPSVAGPNAPGLDVHLDQIATCSWTEVSYSGMVRRHDDAEKPSDDRTDEHVDEDDLEDVDAAFDKHFYHGVPYSRNRMLRYYMDDEMSDDDEDEDDEDEEEHSDDDTDKGENNGYDGKEDGEEDEGNKEEEMAMRTAKAT
ncbi:hypothetical protein ACHAPT_005431 [Fusarium lateritium]